jgi:hypothetical protein
MYYAIKFSNLINQKKMKNRFKSGQTVLFHPPGKAVDYGYINRGLLFTVICEHSPQNDHYLLMKMNNCELIQMVHGNDLRAATEGEC